MKCEGPLTGKTAYYTPTFARRVCQAILQGYDPDELKKELQGLVEPQELTGMGTVCGCPPKGEFGYPLQCGHCNHLAQSAIQGDSECLVAQGSRNSLGDGLSKEEIRRRLYLLHSATGHGPLKHLVQSLKRRGVSSEIIEEAEKFECSVCKEKGRPKPRPFASLEPHPPKWSTVSGDVGHWEHPQTKEHVQFLMVVDEGSRFRVGRVVASGKRSHINAAQFVSTFQECWLQYFGNPHVLRVDPDGTFRSTHVQEFCDSRNIYLDIIPGEAHWKLGICEQAIQGTKSVMSKLVEDHPDLEPRDLLAEATRVFNNREMVRGYSPIQHAVGRAPDTCGRIFPTRDNGSPDLLVENASGEMSRQLTRMADAERAFLEWTNNQRLLKAKHSKPRDLEVYQPGDLVYIWRKQVSGQAAVKGGSFVGPARILAVEKKISADGTRKESSSIWCVRGRRLLKCSPEQLRMASQREVLLEELHQKQYDDWDFHRVAEQLGGNEFLDLTQEVPDDEEWQRAQDEDHEWQPFRRLRMKRSRLEELGTPSERPGLGDDDVRETGRSRSRSPVVAREAPIQESVQTRPRLQPPSGFLAAPKWWEQPEVQQHCAPTACSFWVDETAAVAVEIEMPTTRAASERALDDLLGFFTNSLRKRTGIEVYEKNLSEEERAQFRSAKAVEVTNFLAGKAFEAIPTHLQPSKEQAVRMRWILTWKYKEDGGKKAKARAVLLGYQDPCYEQRATHSPTTTRQTRQLQMQLAASLKHKMRKGDVSGAFLQSRPYPGELYCIPSPEICEGMKIPAESVTKVRKACYGLVDAPLEWYRSVSECFSRLQLQRCWSDPCCWVYVVDGTTKGIISAHVDDFLFSGDENHPGWCAILEGIKKEYRWSDWEHGKFTQCGVQVEQLADFSFSLSQEKYVTDLKYINLRAQRKKDKHSETDPWEKTQLRALLGGISWHAQQVAPHFSAEVSFLLSEVNHSTIDTVLRCNKLLDKVKDMKDHHMRIHSIPPDELHLYVWVDAGSQNRPDGSSTQGIVVAAASNKLLEGECKDVSFVTWHSQKIDRKCRSPGAAEAVAAINGEDYLFFSRFQMSEMLGNPVGVRNANETVNRVGGCLITDSRNVYDKLETETLSIKGAEKRTDIEMLALKSAQIRNRVVIRWVHSEAQLANGLTKANEFKQLQLFYQMRQRWRIVEDANRASARRRKQLGLGPLEVPEDLGDGTVCMHSNTQHKNVPVCGEDDI